MVLVVNNRSSFLRRLWAMLAIALVLVLDVLAACPEAHEFFHHDVRVEDHECVVTHFVHGSPTLLDFNPPVAEPVLVTTDEPLLFIAVILPAASSFLQPPGGGPPAV